MMEVVRGCCLKTEALGLSDGLDVGPGRKGEVRAWESVL